MDTSEGFAGEYEDQAKHKDVIATVRMILTIVALIIGICL